MDLVYDTLRYNTFYNHIIFIISDPITVRVSFQEEYEELLKYAVVVPTFDPTSVPQTLTDVKGSFNPLKTRSPQETHGSVEGDDFEASK